MPDETPPIRIPAIVRALIDPYRMIMAGGQDEQDILLGVPQDPHFIERTFVPEEDRPTTEQVCAIGRVATSWSVLERVLGMALTRLSMSPDFPGMALTKDLGLDYQLKALKTLIALHDQRYRQQIVDRSWLAILINMIPEFKRLKDERNIVVHTVWHRSGEYLHALRARPTTEAVAEKTPTPKRNVEDLNALAANIQKLADAMFIVVQQLPEVDEGQHAKSLALRSRPPVHSPSKPDPPVSSQE